MNPNDFLNDIEWRLADLFGKFAGKEWPIIWKDSGAVRPGKNFLSLKITTGPTGVGDDDLVMEGTEQFQNGLRELMLSVQAFGPGARTVISRLISRRGRPEWTVECERLGLGLNNIPQLVNLSELTETDFEERANADFGFYLGYQERTNETYIETVTVSQTV